MANDLTVDGFVSQLGDRLAKWRTRTKISLTALVCTLVLSGGALLTAASMGPATSLGSVDVPQAVVTALKAVPGAKDEATPQAEQGEPSGSLLGASTSNAMPFDSAVGSAFETLFPIVIVSFVACLFIGLARYMFFEETTPQLLLVGVCGICAALIMKTMFLDDISAITSSSEAPNAISTQALAEQGLSLEQMVSRSRYANSSEGIYVLAQEAIKIAPPKRTPDQRHTINAAAANLQQPMTFTPRPEVAYLIERDAFGKPVSRAAQQYAQSKLSNKAVAIQVGGVMAQLSLVALLTSLICGAIKSAINARLRRVRKLVAQHITTADEPLEAA
ncbi:hypothetical protein JWH16_04615 [Xanthomonas campestris pv. campestris]|uniref:hypothetical protein n=1 Tax=Xanthomonas campestris TaxID=339 RepID=UPI001E38BC6A|nr:hypothetical protein [Xanthomonas campestris]MCD0253138.1 hypothetical protein [Xanthomonas campestris pv. campestris]